MSRWRSREALEAGKVQGAGGDLAYRCVKRATELAALRATYRLVATAPLNKEALHWQAQLSKYTELLMTLTHSRDYAMVLYTDVQ